MIRYTDSSNDTAAQTMKIDILRKKKWKKIFWVDSHEREKIETSIIKRNDFIIWYKNNSTEFYKYDLHFYVYLVYLV